MSKTITYFTTSSVPTAAELVEIATINAIAASPYEVTVLCGKPKNKLTSICLSAAATDNSYSDAGGSIAAGTISASSTDNSLNDSGNGFVTGGFQVGDVLTIAGFSGTLTNNTAGEAIVVSVTAAKMILSGVTLTTDAAGETVTVTSAGRFLTWGFKVGQDVMVRGFTTAANNISTGIITALTASKMTIGGTDGDGIDDEVAGDSVTICSVESDATYGDVTITSDYIAGTVPPQYLDADGTPIGSLVVFDPANPPDVTALISTQAVISHGETVVVKTNGGATSDNATATVVAHACTVALPATQTVLQNADTTTISGKSIALAVGSGALGVATFAAATDAAISNGASTTVSSKPITLAVGTNSLGIATLTNATDAAISNGATTTLAGSAISLAVANRTLGVATLTATDAKLVTHGEFTDSISGSGTRATFSVVEGVLSIVLSTP